MKTFLHVGCGPNYKDKIKGFNNERWKEIRFDIDEKVRPDIIGTLTDMKLVETASVDAIYSAYNLDHIYAHEIPIVLKEFHRVLKEDGFALVRCPDLQTMGELIAQDKYLEILYQSQIGPVYPIDVIYGHRGEIEAGNEYMVKKCGFTYSALDASFSVAGFKARYGGRLTTNGGELGMVAFKQEKSEEEIKKIADPIFPY